jgi:uncharacterized alkaline shock family protein YloU
MIKEGFMKDVKKTASAKDTVKAPPGKTNELGAIRISDSVISSLVRKAALSVEGVSRLASTFVDNIAEIVGSRKTSYRSININMDEDRVEIEVKLNIKFGYKVPEVAGNVQTAIVEAVEHTTGMNVTSVNVIVQEIEELVDENNENHISDEIIDEK